MRKMRLGPRGKKPETPMFVMDSPLAAWEEVRGKAKRGMERNNTVTVHVEVGMDIGVIKDRELVFSLSKVEHQFSHVLLHRPGEALTVQWIEPNTVLVTVGKQPVTLKPQVTRRVLRGLQYLLRSLWDTIVTVELSGKKHRR